MLDAAHGKPVGPVRIVQRIHYARFEEQVCRVDVAGRESRRGPIVAGDTGISQGPRLPVADARSR